MVGIPTIVDFRYRYVMTSRDAGCVFERDGRRSDDVTLDKKKDRFCEVN